MRNAAGFPMVKIDKDYVFDGPNSKTSLKDLFEGRHQLIIYHFMFDPKWEKGCPGCTGFVDALGDLSLLNKTDTTFAVISRAPLAKLEAYKTEKGWDISWLSSFGSDFNYDFHTTLDPKVAPQEYNFRNKAETEAAKGHSVVMEGEAHGLSCLLPHRRRYFPYLFGLRTWYRITHRLIPPPRCHTLRQATGF